MTIAVIATSRELGALALRSPVSPQNVQQNCNVGDPHAREEVRTASFVVFIRGWMCPDGASSLARDIPAGTSGKCRITSRGNMLDAIEFWTEIGEEHTIRVPADVPIGRARVIVLVESDEAGRRANNADKLGKLVEKYRGRIVTSDDFNEALPPEV
jgi:hypothetical protein